MDTASQNCYNSFTVGHSRSTVIEVINLLLDTARSTYVTVLQLDTASQNCYNIFTVGHSGSNWSNSFTFWHSASNLSNSFTVGHS